MKAGSRAPRAGGRGLVVVAAITVAITAALAGGCASNKPKLVDFSETPRSYSPADYGDVYERWTRHERALYDVDSALEAWTTFKSWDFREAYIERYAAVYGLSDDDRTALRRSQMEEFRKAYEFHMTAQSANYKWNDLEKSSSAWRLTLIDALGHELAPESVKVMRLPDAYESGFFPAKTPFSKTYNVRFPGPGSATATDFAGPKTGSITLRVSSPIGRIEMVWRGS
jgi:hypothetical protein